MEFRTSLTAVSLRVREPVMSWEDLPATGELGDTRLVRTAQITYLFDGDQWVELGASRPGRMPLSAERYLHRFEGVRVLFRVPVEQVMPGNYEYAHRLLDSDPVEALEQRVRESFPGVCFSIMDGRSSIPLTCIRTMGQLRNTYEHSRRCP